MINSYPTWLNDILICPQTKEKLHVENLSYCSSSTRYSFENGILSIVFPPELIGDDAKFNKFYNWWAPIYDLNERVLGKLIAGVNMEEARKYIVSLLGIKPGMRLLEVSPGPGVYQNFLHDELGNEGQFVALDLSMGMLLQCAKMKIKYDVQLVHGNAQYLPFADNSFDALFHFGGVNLFNNPQLALQEFVRVVKKNGIVSWGDEGFSSNFPKDTRRQILSKMNPGYLKPHPPIPNNVCDVQEFEVANGLGYLVVAKKQ